MRLKTINESIDALPDHIQRIFGQTLGVGKYAPPRPKYQCPNCNGNKAHIKEIHADTGMDEMVGYCPECQTRGDPKTFKRIS